MLRHRTNAAASSVRDVLDRASPSIRIHRSFSQVDIVYPRDPLSPHEPGAHHSRCVRIVHPDLRTSQKSIIHISPSFLPLRDTFPVDPEHSSSRRFCPRSIISSAGATSPNHTPAATQSSRRALSLSHQNSNYERGLESLSPPSSRLDTPISSLSQAFSANVTPQSSLNSLYYSISPNSPSFTPPQRAPLARQDSLALRLPRQTVRSIF